MSFSARQQICLEAMGMVPWVSNVLPTAPLAADPLAGMQAPEPLAGTQVPEPLAGTQVPEPLAGTQVPEPLAGTQVPAAPLSAEQLLAELPADLLSDTPAALPAQMPTDLQSLSAWLSYQPLSSFLASGKRRHVMGRDDASLVVVVETGSGVGQHPLEGDAARLFDMMMKAIKLTRQQLRICALAGDSVESESGSGADAGDERAAEQPTRTTLSDICNPQTKAVLLFVQRWDAPDDCVTSQDDTVRLAAPPCPVWRIPHPDILLSRNQLKRQAWQSLQALQRVL